MTQMTPLDVQTSGAKWFGTYLLVLDHIPTQCCEMFTQAVHPLRHCPPGSGVDQHSGQLE